MTDWEKMTFDTNPDIRIGISSCLLGEEVRYNGGHAHDSFITAGFGQFFNWIPVCPEFEVGMGVPRETVQLTEDSNDIRMVAPQSGADWTERMNRYSRARVSELSKSPLHGFILKKNSPSCGMERVNIYGKKGMLRKDGRGLFATELMQKLPLLPVEEEGRLRDPHLRENFFERVFAYYRLQQFLSNSPTPADLVEFHTRHKLTVMSHHQTKYRELGRLVAEAGTADFPQLLEEYRVRFMEGLKIKATPGNHVNVLHHAMGYFSNELTGDDRKELIEYIEQYRSGLVPLVVPITLVKHYLRRYPTGWLVKQVYFNPYPHELKLRNLI